MLHRHLVDLQHHSTFHPCGLQEKECRVQTLQGVDPSGSMGGAGADVTPVLVERWRWLSLVVVEVEAVQMLSELFKKNINHLPYHVCAVQFPIRHVVDRLSSVYQVGSVSSASTKIERNTDVDACRLEQQPN